MKMIVAQTLDAAREAAETAAPGDGSKPWSHDPGAPDPASSSALGAALVAFEAVAETERPESLLLCDDSEPSLAAALVASKLLIPTEALPAAHDDRTANGRVLAQLTAAYTAPA